MLFILQSPLSGATMGQANNQQVIFLRWPASDYYIINDSLALIMQGLRESILGKIPGINMIFLLLLNIYNNH